MKRASARLLVTLLAACCASACSTSLFHYEPIEDATVDAEGNIRVRDTARNWETFKANTDILVRQEVAKGRPQGRSSWNALWHALIDANSDRENAAKYIDYVVTARRQAGLPELVEEEAAQ